ncbi:ABC transporter permease [Actinacidiphila acididurans]|uniref:ABC transporter permease n=1 Tax=Actinacidiphila acididurans TaxID=2784346 RepID=A0ABS2TZN7_9ACTN|nr:ABC transporter permease [Actinacidiphila acididurans]MBM9507755.1 ABC transporter permease [Actinacidiphila acididurans]
MPDAQDPLEPVDPHQAVAPAGGYGGGFDLAAADAQILEGPAGRAQDGGPLAKPRSLWSDAWHDLRRNPIFIVSALIILFLLFIVIWPQAITTQDPLKANLAMSQAGPSAGHPFGFDNQGRDVYTRVVYGARASVSVGLCATIGVVLAGSALGALAGYFGGWWDAVLSRISDIFFGIPVILGGLVFLSVVTNSTIWPVVGFMVLLGWPQVARIARGSVITARQNDYVLAARALGAGDSRLLLRHIAPNAVAPVIVVGTIALGTYIALEATLSYLGVGLRPPTVSWGIDISDASNQIRNAPHMLLWPAGALSLTVLAFIMLGDAVRDALDPKLR